MIINSDIFKKNWKKYTYNQMNEKVNNYITNVTYNSSDYTTSSISTYTTTTSYRKDRPTSLILNLPSSGTLVISNGENSSIKYSVAAAGDFTIDNLIPNITYTYTLYDINNNIIEAGSILPTGQVRMINGGGGTYNIRDLGGWPCDGGSLNYGKIFRGPQLDDEAGNVLNNLQKDFFINNLKISQDIDFRGPSEVDGLDNIEGTTDDIVGSAMGTSVDYIRIPILEYGATNDIQKARYINVFKTIIENLTKNRTCYIHCAAGADRTGTISALIEGLCGVSQSDIDKDYEITSFSGRERVRTNNYYTSFINAITAMPGSTFRDKVVDYMLDCGLNINEINFLRQKMINGTPSLVTSSFSNLSVSNVLTNVTSSNTSNSIAKYDFYSTTLSVAQDLILTNINITMNNEDITLDVYNDFTHEIFIPRVTGPLIITAEAIDINNYVDLVPLSTTSDDVTIYNSGLGYKNGAYVSGVSDGTDTNYIATGYIEYNVPSTGLPNTIYVRNGIWEGDHARISLFNSNHEFLTSISRTASSGLGNYWTKTDLGNNYFKLEPISSGNTSALYAASSDIAYVRFSFKRSDANIVIATSPIPFVYEVGYLAVAPRSNWETNSAGEANTTNLSLTNDNICLALGVSKDTGFIGHTDREGNPIYIMPVPSQAKKITVFSKDASLTKIYFRGIKLTENNNYTRIFNTNWVNDFSYTFGLNSIDYICIALQTGNSSNVAWGYNDSNIRVIFQ